MCIWDIEPLSFMKQFGSPHMFILYVCIIFSVGEHGTFRHLKAMSKYLDTTSVFLAAVCFKYSVSVKISWYIQQQTQMS